jgi:hypothetical protein
MRRSRPLTRLLTKILRCVPTDFHAVGLPSFASPPGEGESEARLRDAPGTTVPATCRYLRPAVNDCAKSGRPDSPHLAAVDLPQLMIERPGRISNREPVNS